MKKCLLVIIALCVFQFAFSQHYTVGGRVISQKDHSPIEFATVFLPENELWAVTNQKGEFVIKNIPSGKVTFTVSSLGYAKVNREVNINGDIADFTISLPESNLSLDEVVVTAQLKTANSTTAYVLDRTTLDHAQILNATDILSLLPGGKSAVNPNMAKSDKRFALRSADNELGNATFGTAVEVDGVRLQNNATFDEIKGFDTRSLSTINIESVEVITGIPSVEYGDLTSGMVKINTRKGKTPFVAEFSTRPNTKQIGLNKGIALGAKGGILNVSWEYTKSTSDLASPYTSYDRNTLSINYSTSLNKSKNTPLTLKVGLNGNMGGFDSKADPDAFKDNYTKRKDNTLSGNVKLHWLLNKPWITNLELSGSASYADRFSKMNVDKSSSSTQSAIHTTQEGYFIATKYDENPHAPILLLPTGYWYQLSYYDSKPIDYSAKLKADWVRRWGKVTNKILLGGDFNRSGNEGKGSYYDDMRYAPTWREYRLNEVPYMNNLGLYLEDKVTLPVNELSTLQLTAGLRSDITIIKGSEYGTAHSLSPRFSARYTFWEKTDKVVEDLSIYGGWGKAVKLPSFGILYPSPTYSDKLAFTPGTMSDGTTFYAYYSMPSQAIYNPDLKWQHSKQTEIGVEARIKGTKIAISAFKNKTYDPYVISNIYTPYSYNFTSQSALEGFPIPSADRNYTINQSTGIVTVSDKTGTHPDQELAYTTRDTYKTNKMYINGSAIERWGVDWSIDFPEIPTIRTSIRLDGNFYHYKGLNENITAWIPSSSATGTDGKPYKYVGYYAGSSTSAGSSNKLSTTELVSSGGSSSASASNGSLSKQVNANMTVSTHIPKLRLIFSLKIEGSFYNYKRYLSEYNGANRGFVLEDGEGYRVYPLYYTSWNDPNTQIPFAETFAWAKENDPDLYTDLSQLVVKSNTTYFFNPQKISSYFSANISITKEIGRYASISFYANNFLNNMNRIKNTWNDTESSLYNSTYIPKFYYGLALRLKL
ncbi:TonB-dependent receptor [Bacteroides sp. 224]|uniref:TonB-dependent receptor n=1 Tax=Bacteroides sp. 224 TaxID=2302936 RepID=UPI0013D45150|nr:TonB-dependent receptor [Bacteroides sp. 224]NDV67038.1 TonB-dependent receptor [Bacteroides sp. 224]